MKLREIAHARAGDKGNIVNIALIAYNEENYSLLEEQVTVERVSQLFASLTTGPVDRFCIPRLGALNFVLYRPASESVTRSLALDGHGKTLSFLLLNMDIGYPSTVGRRAAITRSGQLERCPESPLRVPATRRPR